MLTDRFGSSLEPSAYRGLVNVQHLTNFSQCSLVEIVSRENEALFSRLAAESSPNCMSQLRPDSAVWLVRAIRHRHIMPFIVHRFFAKGAPMVINESLR